MTKPKKLKKNKTEKMEKTTKEAVDEVLNTFTTTTTSSQANIAKICTICGHTGHYTSEHDIWESACKDLEPKSEVTKGDVNKILDEEMKKPTEFDSRSCSPLHPVWEKKEAENDDGPNFFGDYKDNDFRIESDTHKEIFKMDKAYQTLNLLEKQSMLVLLQKWVEKELKAIKKTASDVEYTRYSRKIRKDAWDELVNKFEGDYDKICKYLDEEEKTNETPKDSCPACGSSDITLTGQKDKGNPIWKCNQCGSYFAFTISVEPFEAKLENGEIKMKDNNVCKSCQGKGYFMQNGIVQTCWDCLINKVEDMIK
jgi:ribosomal protein L37AE/L43A